MRKTLLVKWIILVKTSKLVTEITNTRGITTGLKPEFAHNPEHFPPFSCQKMVCSGVRYLSYESAKYSANFCLGTYIYKNHFLCSKKESERSQKCIWSKINNSKSYSFDYNRFKPKLVLQKHFRLNIRENRHYINMVKMEWKKLGVLDLSLNSL